MFRVKGHLHYRFRVLRCFGVRSVRRTFFCGLHRTQRRCRDEEHPDDDDCGGHRCCQASNAHGVLVGALVRTSRTWYRVALRSHLGVGPRHAEHRHDTSKRVPRLRGHHRDEPAALALVDLVQLRRGTNGFGLNISWCVGIVFTGVVFTAIVFVGIVYPANLDVASVLRLVHAGYLLGSRGGCGNGWRTQCVCTCGV